MPLAAVLAVVPAAPVTALRTWWRAQLLQISVDAAQTQVYIRTMDIDQLIAASGKTKRQVAAESGVSRQTIRMIAKGSNPRVEVAAKLASAIGCSVYDIKPDLREIMQ